MNPRILKESHELLPVVPVSITVSLLVLAILGRDAEPLLVAFALFCAVLSGLSFGSEFQHRTLPLLLSQPVPRPVLWREKMVVLGTGIAVLLGELWLCVDMRREHFETLLLPVLIAACAFCGGPYFATQAQSSFLGAVVTIGTPCGVLGLGALALAIGAKFEPRLLENEGLATYAGVFLMVGYCAVMFVLSYRGFMNLQVLDLPRQELAIPARFESIFIHPFSRLSARFSGPFATLIKKEVRLQQPAFILTGAFCLFALLGLALKRIYPEAATITWTVDVAVFILVLPFLAGAISVGEEQGWGVSEWHLTLPPSARKQWLAKTAVALCTSFFLGLVLPCGPFLVGWALGIFPSTDRFPSLEAAILVVLSQLALVNLSMYGSSVAGNTLRGWLLGLGLTVGVMSFTFWSAILLERGLMPVFFPAAQTRTRLENFWWEISLAGLPVLICLAQWFAFNNYRYRGLDKKRLGKQLLLILVALPVFFSVSLYVIHLLISRNSPPTFGAYTARDIWS